MLKIVGNGDYQITKTVELPRDSPQTVVEINCQKRKWSKTGSLSLLTVLLVLIVYHAALSTHFSNVCMVEMQSKWWCKIHENTTVSYIDTNVFLQ